MKLFNLMVAASFSLGAVGADYTGAYLVRDIGTSGHTGIATTCQIFGNYPKLKLEEVKKQIEQAAADAKKPGNFDSHVYARFNTPSKNYVAKLVTEKDGKFHTTDVPLLTDGGSYKALKTASGKKLILLLDSLCGKAQPDPLEDAGIEKDEKE